MPLQRQRIRIGTKDNGTALLKWVQGKTTDELNDSIARAYVEYGLLDKLLSDDERKVLACHLLETLGLLPIEIEKQEAPLPAGKAVTFKSYTQTWFKIYKEGKLKPTTLTGYRSNLRKHIYPALGSLRFDEITTETLQKFLTDRQDMARNTLHTMLVLISEILDSAVEDGLIAKNPALSKRLFIPSDKKERRKALTLEETRDIIRQLHTAKNPDHRRLLALMLFTGMRRGEVMALRWEDIDFEKDEISVSKAVSYPVNQPILAGTKTHNGIRTIPLNPQLKELLKPYGKEGFIFGGEKPLTKMVYERVMKEINREFDLHGATPHVFRHSFLSMLNRAGVDPKTIQAIGGHGNFQLTYDVYVHADNQQIKNAGERVNQLLSS